MRSHSAELEMEDDDEFSKFIRRMNLPRVVIDNDSSGDATVIRVDSIINKHGILLEVVQVLTDLNLNIKKAYISSDGNWFMDVFNVTDRDGNKVFDNNTISYIKKSLESDACFFPKPWSSIGITPSKEYTLIELTGSDRPGLLSEISAVLATQLCHIAKAELWTHNARVAAVLHVADESTEGAIEDPGRISRIKELLCNVLKGEGDPRMDKTTASMGRIHTQRRLHQLMLDDRDYERADARPEAAEEKSSRPQVTVMDCSEKEYTVVVLNSKDRPKLLFDTICTLTDTQYVVYHGTVSSAKEEAYQEYYIRHVDGNPIRSERERRRLIRCLEAAIERRSSEGLELELRTDDGVGSLSEVTRVLRENGLTIRRAKISTEEGGKVVAHTFHLAETSGSPVDAKTIDSIRRQLGKMVLSVRQHGARIQAEPEPPPEVVGGTVSLYIANLFRASLQSFRLIRSYS